MKDLKEALWLNYEEASAELEKWEVGSEEHKLVLEERDKLRNELLRLEQIESEDMREKIRNGITIGTFTVSTIVSIYSICKTFKFDQVATVTSTLGRNILNGVVPKILKK